MCVCVCVCACVSEREREREEREREKKEGLEYCNTYFISNINRAFLPYLLVTMT